MSAKTRPSSAGRSRMGSSSGAKSGSGRKIVRSLPEFILFLETDLLPRIVSEEDPTKRKSLGSTFKDHLNGLNTALRARQMAREQNRRDVYTRIGEDGSHKAFSGDLLASNGFSDWQKHEHAADEKVLEALHKYVHSQELNNQMLRETLDRRQNIENNLFPSKPTPDTSVLKRRASQIDRISMLEGLLKKQDADISVLQHQIEEQTMNYILLPKQDYLEMDRMIQPFIVARRMSNLGNNAALSRQISSRTTADGLRGDVINLVEQIERLQGRVKQVSLTVTDQEKDKSVSLEILQHKHHSAEQLREVIAEKVTEWNEDRSHMESEIKSLRSNIETLAMENRKLMESLSKHEEEKEKRDREARARRLSMPGPAAAEEGIKKAEEKRKRRVTVASNPSTPRINAMELTLDGGHLGNGGLRPKSRHSVSASRSGPLRAGAHRFGHS